MSARHLCKAKRTDNGEWVEGYLYRLSERLNPFIMLINRSGESYEVDPSTICQGTGLPDKNGKLIWENDIVRLVYDGKEYIYQVVWDVSELDFKATNGEENYGSNFQYLTCCEEIEVIGSIFDNPSLLKGGVK